jgi:hypothetical protein
MTHSEHCASAVETDVARMSKSEDPIAENILGMQNATLLLPVFICAHPIRNDNHLEK